MGLFISFVIVEMKFLFIQCCNFQTWSSLTVIGTERFDFGRQKSLRHLVQVKFLSQQKLTLSQLVEQKTSSYNL